MSVKYVANVAKLAMHSECIGRLITSKGNALINTFTPFFVQTSLLCQVKWCYKLMESANKRSSAEIWNVTSAENDANLAHLWKHTTQYTTKSSNIKAYLSKMLSTKKLNPFFVQTWVLFLTVWCQKYGLRGLPSSSATPVVKLWQKRGTWKGT